MASETTPATFPENFNAEFSIPFGPNASGEYTGELKRTSALTTSEAAKTIANVLGIDHSKIKITKQDENQ